MPASSAGLKLEPGHTASVLQDTALRFTSKGAPVQIAGMTLLTLLSLKTTRPKIHEENRFSWAPIVEVAKADGPLQEDAVLALHRFGMGPRPGVGVGMGRA